MDTEKTYTIHVKGERAGEVFLSLSGRIEIGNLDLFSSEADDPILATTSLSWKSPDLRLRKGKKGKRIFHPKKKLSPKSPRDSCKIPRFAPC
jgi:hypothetical protein